MDTPGQYEQLLQRLVSSYDNKIKQIYYREIESVALTSSFIQGGLPFNLDDYPLIKKRIDGAITKMHSSIQASIVNSINLAWELSNKKNDDISDGLTADMDIARAAMKLIYDPNLGALKSFTTRKESGLNLSDRVWNSVNGYRHELEAGLTDGIATGESAAGIATKLKRYLNEPDNLFRRVRDENGQLQLSRAARAYHPGQGVYRSSFQNALRLSGSETNIAYRSSDYERWKNQTFVTGMRVEVSNNHPVYDECNELAGEYPKAFKFTGWHPRCRCHAIPLLISDKQFSLVENSVLGVAGDAPGIKYVDKIPDKAATWIEDNAERINGWKNEPYWVKDNPNYVDELLNPKIK